MTVPEFSTCSIEPVDPKDWESGGRPVSCVRVMIRWRQDWTHLRVHVGPVHIAIPGVVSAGWTLVNQPSI